MAEKWRAFTFSGFLFLPEPELPLKFQIALLFCGRSQLWKLRAPGFLDWGKKNPLTLQPGEKLGVLKTSVKTQTPRHLFKNVPSFQTWSFLKCCLKASNVAWWFEVEGARSSQSTLKQTLFQEPYYLYHTICIETTRVTLWWHQRHYYRKITW